MAPLVGINSPLGKMPAGKMSGRCSTVVHGAAVWAGRAGDHAGRMAAGGALPGWQRRRTICRNPPGGGGSRNRGTPCKSSGAGKAGGEKIWPSPAIGSVSFTCRKEAVLNCAAATATASVPAQTKLSADLAGSCFPVPAEQQRLQQPTAQAISPALAPAGKQDRKGQKMGNDTASRITRLRSRERRSCIIVSIRSETNQLA